MADIVLHALDFSGSYSGLNGIHRIPVHAACLTDLSTCPLTVLLVDPPGGDAPQKTLFVPIGAFAHFYYDNLASFIRQFGELVRVDGLPEYSWAPVRDIDLPMPQFARALDLYIGLPTHMIGDPGRAMERHRTELETGSPYVGSDFIALAGRMPDWEA